MLYEHRWLAVTAIGLSLFLSALDATIVALALPSIAHHFQLSDSLVSIVILSYAIPLTILILPSGDLISRFDTLPTFLIAVLGSRLASVCGPLVLGFTWTFLASFSVQMAIGMLIIDGFVVLNLLFAWLSVQRRSQRLSASQEAA